jgi:raffinose/stachyose/melibiose transport system substrate-binding protein
VDFLGYISSLDVANRLGEDGGTLPVVKGSASSVTDPQMLQVVDYLANGTYTQLYLDQATSPELGAIINDSIQELYAGISSPADVAGKIAAAAAG